MARRVPQMHWERCRRCAIAICQLSNHDPFFSAPGSLPQSLWEFLQIVSIASMEQITIQELLMTVDTRTEHIDIPNQLEINYS